MWQWLGLKLRLLSELRGGFAQQNNRRSPRDRDRSCCPWTRHWFARVALPSHLLVSYASVLFPVWIPFQRQERSARGNAPEFPTPSDAVRSRRHNRDLPVDSIWEYNQSLPILRATRGYGVFHTSIESYFLLHAALVSNLPVLHRSHVRGVDPVRATRCACRDRRIIGRRLHVNGLRERLLTLEHQDRFCRALLFPPGFVAAESKMLDGRRFPAWTLPLCALGWIIASLWNPKAANLAGETIGNPALFLLASICGIWALARLARLTATSRALSFLGKNTLPIFAFNYPLNLFAQWLFAPTTPWFVFAASEMALAVGFVFLLRRIPAIARVFSIESGQRASPTAV